MTVNECFSLRTVRKMEYCFPDTCRFLSSNITLRTFWLSRERHNELSFRFPTSHQENPPILLQEAS